MTFVVTENCIQCKYTTCVDVCPMDCFLEGPNFLVINPDTCIDCSMCVPECPVAAIVGDREIAEDQYQFIALNASLAKHPNWRPIAKSKAPLPEHKHWAQVKNKLPLLDDTAGTKSAQIFQLIADFLPIEVSMRSQDARAEIAKLEGQVETPGTENIAPGSRILRPGA